MATSGSFDYTVTALQVMTAAYEDIQVVQEGDSPNTNQQTMGLRTLNLMTKEWMGKPTFAPGLKRWTRNFIYVFMRLNVNIYVLAQAQSGANNAALNTYNSATLTSAANSGQAVINISSVTSWPRNVVTGSIANTDIIGVLLSTGDFQWTTVSSGGGTSTLTLAANLTANAASGAQVFSYTAANVVDLPLEFVTCVRRDINGIDYPMDKMFDMYTYEQIANKNITSTPIQWFWEKKRINGNIYLDCFPATMTDVLRICALYPIDDEDSVSNDMAFPQQWYGALEWGLAKKLAPKFGKAWTETMEQNYMEAMSSASAVDPETVPQYFQPNRDDYGSNFSGLK